MIALLASHIVPVLVGLGVLFGGAAVILWKVRRSGIRHQQDADAREALKHVQTRDKVERDVARQSDDDVARDLRENWTRK